MQSNQNKLKLLKASAEQKCSFKVCHNLQDKTLFSTTFTHSTPAATTGPYIQHKYPGSHNSTANRLKNINLNIARMLSIDRRLNKREMKLNFYSALKIFKLTISFPCPAGLSGQYVKLCQLSEGEMLFEKVIKYFKYIQNWNPTEKRVISVLFTCTFFLTETQQLF